MRNNGMDHTFPVSGDSSLAEYGQLMDRLLAIETEVSACHDALDSLAGASRLTPAEQKSAMALSRKIAELESNRTYFEFSLFMDYSLKRAFENDDSTDETRVGLIKKIRDRNPFYLKN